MSISILLLTLDEEANLPACLASVDWSDDVVVLDSFSRDRTVAVAESGGARIFQRSFDSFASQRNHALDSIDFKHDWILHLDADEIVTPGLREEMLKTIQSEKYDAYRIPSKMMFLGRWLRYSGLYPSYQVRLGRRGRFRFKQVGHGQREDVAPERVGILAEPYLHYSFSKGITDWIDKHNRYASDEAREAVRLIAEGRDVEWRKLVSRDQVQRRRALKELSYRLPFRPLFRFLYMYLLRRGFLDGHAGLTYCRLLSIYESLIEIKIHEQQRQKVGDAAGQAVSVTDHIITHRPDAG